MSCISIVGFFLPISGVVGKVPVYASQEVTSKGRDVYP